MTKQVINIGAAPNDGTGDPARVSFDKCNQNFTELYSALAVDLSAYAPLASPVFTGDPQAPTPAPGDNDTSIATTAFVKSAVTAANQVFYCDLTDAADVATYKRLLSAPSTHAETSASAVCTGTTSDFLIASFITDPGVPGAISFPAGSAYRRLYGSVSGGAAMFRLQVYTRTSGGVETLGRDEFSNTFSDTVATLQEWLATPSGGGSLSTTDRLVVKVSARRVSGPTNVTVTLYSEGSAHASQIQTTITMGSSAPISATPPLALTGGNLTIDLSGYQPLDADLTAIAALTGTNVIAYRAAANSWAAVTIGTGLSFTGGTLDRAALTGDVTTTANAATIANDAVTYAKLQNVSAASRLIGRGSAAGAGDPQEITLGTNLAMSGTTLNAAGGGGSAFTASSTAPVAPNPGDHWYDLSTGTLSIYVNDGNSSQWVMVSPSGSGVAVQNYITGLVLSNNGADAVNDIDATAGQAMDSTNAAMMTLASTLTKRLDANWVVGTNQGGLDTGAIANNTYHVWLIQRSDTSVVDVLFSLSASAPTMPANYDRKRRIGSILRASAAIVLFTQAGSGEIRFYRLTTPTLDVNVTNLGTASVTYTLALPTGIAVLACLNAGASASATVAVYIRALTETDTAPSATAAPLFNVRGLAASTLGGAQIQIMTNTSAQIAARSNVGSTTFVVAPVGWWDYL